MNRVGQPIFTRVDAQFPWKIVEIYFDNLCVFCLKIAAIALQVGGLLEMQCRRNFNLFSISIESIKKIGRVSMEAVEACVA